MGQPGTYHHYGTGWANVCCAPFRLYKHFAHEGGISSPSILWWGNRVKHPGGIDHQPCHLIDIMATCLDAAGIGYPDEYEGRQLVPAEGVSLLPLPGDGGFPSVRSSLNTRETAWYDSDDGSSWLPISTDSNGNSTTLRTTVPSSITCRPGIPAGLTEWHNAISDGPMPTVYCPIRS